MLTLLKNSYGRTLHFLCPFPMILWVIYSMDLLLGRLILDEKKCLQTVFNWVSKPENKACIDNGMGDIKSYFNQEQHLGIRIF